MRHEWRAYGINDINISLDSFAVCMMISRETGKTYTKLFNDLSAPEIYQVAGSDLFVAYYNPKEDF